MNKYATKWRYIFLGLLVLTGYETVFCAEEEEEKPSFVQKIAEINMRSFGWEDDNWDAHTMQEFLQKHMERRLKPTKKQKRRMAFEFYKKLEKERTNHSTVLFDAETTWNDLTLFCGQSTKNLYVAEKLARTQTELGKGSLFLMLAEPIKDVDRLKKRQQVIQTILDDSSLITQFDALFNPLAVPENVFLSFYHQDPLVHAVKNHCEYGDYIDALNENELALLCRSIYGHQQRLGWALGNAAAALVLTTYGVLNLTNGMPDQVKEWADDYKGSPGPVFPWLWKINNNWIKSFIAITGGVLCGLHVKNNLEWFRDCLLLEECVHTVTMQLAQFINAASALYKRLAQYPALATFDEFKGLTNFFEKTINESEPLRELLELFSADTFKQESIFSHKGRIIRVYTLMHELKKDFEALAGGIGKLDAYFSLAKLCKEFETKKVHFCMPTYLESEQPMLQITDFWHPLIDQNLVVENSVTLGQDNQRPGMIITGPNAGGKSTILKSIILCIVLAQTIGIAPTQQMSLTPFSSIATYLNIVDDIAVGNSLFKAEVIQAQRLIDKVEQSNKNEFSIIGFDEVFNGTSPVEGSAAAYSVAHHLAQYLNNICLVATHFSILTELEKDTEVFKNYKVSVNRLPSGGIFYPYKLEHGISKQYVALDILRGQGFAGSLLEMAQKIVDKERA